MHNQKCRTLTDLFLYMDIIAIRTSLKSFCFMDDGDTCIIVIQECPLRQCPCRFDCIVLDGLAMHMPTNSLYKHMNRKTYKTVGRLLIEIDLQHIVFN